MQDRFLPYARHAIEDDDVAAVAAALKSDFLTTGPLVERYEAAFADATGAAHAVACNSGTAALHLAALALDLKAGEAAVVPAVTFLATANAVRMTGADVIFADVDPDSGLLTPERLNDAASTAKTRNLKLRAALPVHLNGQLCDMKGLAEASERSGVALIEDACHVLGLPGVGDARHSAAACFSTHPAKAIATAEGGMVTTRDAGAAARMRQLRNHGMTRAPADFARREIAFEGDSANPWYYEMAEIGWNYRIPDVLCALGLAQLHKLERFIARRREIAARYDRLLAPLSPAIRPVSRSNSLHAWHLYVVRVDLPALGTTRAKLMKALLEQGIGAQVHYIPLHMQPYYRQRYGAIALPGAESYYARCLSIPCFPAMDDGDVERVAAALARLVRGHGS